ncbi:DUF3558 domain-containing protein [Actinomycetospora sp. CA-084318]|uniref:DUF3558 domain-containing protein n=1 Tax=Actinomycetospora sp. CA-084318 TaxID=3239892 RepID=UPI003D994CD3
MPTRERAWLITALLAGCLLTACAGPATTGQPASPTSSSRFGAPEVASPRDATATASRPCESLLTRDELAVIGFSGQGRSRTLIDIPECVWTNGRDERLSIAVDTTRDLLADTYRTRLLPIFEPTAVEGMPAVRQRMRVDDNTCTVTTGLGPRQALETEWSGLTNRQTTDPCAKAEEAIALVVRKLPPQR